MVRANREPDAPQLAQNTLWYEAYIACYDGRRNQKDAELLDEMERALVGDEPSSWQPADKEHPDMKTKFEALCKALGSTLKAKVKEIEERRWPLPLTNDRVDFNDAVEKF